MTLPKGVVFFSVLRKTYSGKRLVQVPKALQYKLAPEDIGIAILQTVHMPEMDADGETLLNMLPSSLAHSRIVLLTHVGDCLAQLKQNFLRWSLADKITYSLAVQGLQSDPCVQEVITTLIDAGQELIRSHADSPRTLHELSEGWLCCCKRARWIVALETHKHRSVFPGSVEEGSLTASSPYFEGRASDGDDRVGVASGLAVRIAAPFNPDTAQAPNPALH